MISIVITGHGHFASGLLSAVTQVIGPQAQIAAVDFPPEMSTAQLDTALNSALKALPQEDGVLFFTDLLGGSPFRSAVQIALGLPAGDVIAGTNMQMLAEMLLERDTLTDPAAFVEQALACGRQGLVSFKQKQSQVSVSCASEDGGI